MKQLSWTAVGVVALAIGCAHAPPAPSGSDKPGPQFLVGSEWELRDLGGTPVLEDRSSPTLSFVDPGRVTGNGSCNRYGGSAELGDGTIKVGPLAATKMACTPEVDAQERAYLAALQNASRLQLADGDLLVHSDSLEKPLRFRRTR